MGEDGCGLWGCPGAWLLGVRCLEENEHDIQGEDMAADTQEVLGPRGIAS